MHRYLAQPENPINQYQTTKNKTGEGIEYGDICASYTRIP